MKNKIKVKEIKIIFKSDQILHVCMFRDDFFDFYKIKSLNSALDVNTERYNLQKGFYGSLLGKNIWVRADIPQGYIKIFPLEKTPITSKDESWSINIRISEFEKMMKLKTFW